MPLTSSFCVEILLWILASELRIQLQFFAKMSNSVLHSLGLQLCLTLRDKILRARMPKYCGMRLRHPSGVQGQSLCSEGQRRSPWSWQYYDVRFLKHQCLRFFHVFSIGSSQRYCKDKLFRQGRKPAAGETNFLPPALQYVAFSALSSGTDGQISWHVFHFSRHERACRHVKIGPGSPNQLWHNNSCKQVL